MTRASLILLVAACALWWLSALLRRIASRCKGTVATVLGMYARGVKIVSFFALFAAVVAALFALLGIEITQ